MKHIPPEHQSRLRQSGAIQACLDAAKRKFPGKQLTYCGLENNWEDCLSGFEINGQFRAALYFNIGPNTHAVQHSIAL